MKIRLAYVSNSSSSSFYWNIDKKYLADFEKDLNEFILFLKRMFPKYEDECFEYSIENKEKDKKKITKKYVQEVERVTDPSDDLLDYFMNKLEEKNYFSDESDYFTVKYYIDTEMYETIGFQNLCSEFIEQYQNNKKRIEKS